MKENILKRIIDQEALSPAARMQLQYLMWDIMCLKDIVESRHTSFLMESKVNMLCERLEIEVNTNNQKAV